MRHLSFSDFLTSYPFVSGELFVNFCGSIRIKMAVSFLAKDMSFLKQALAFSDVAAGV